MTNIYVLIDPRDNTPRYIGKANNPLKRLAGHCKDSHKQNTHKNAWLQQLENLKLSPLMEVLEKVPMSCWQEAEIWWISYLSALGAKLTNGTLGGEGLIGYRPTLETRIKMGLSRKDKYKGENAAFYGKKHSKETKEKIALAVTGENHPMFGKHHSEETRIKMSMGKSGELHHFYGKHHSEKSKEKMSKTHSKEIGEKNSFYGKHHSEESREKMSQLAKGRIISPETRKKISDAIKAYHVKLRSN
jgi:group I intron endonuclease